MPRIIYLGTGHPKTYSASHLGEPLVLDPAQPALETHTAIIVSDDSTLVQAVSECKSIWAIHAHEDVPLWIGHNPAALMLAQVLGAEFGGNVELRSLE